MSRSDWWALVVYGVLMGLLLTGLLAAWYGVL